MLSPVDFARGSFTTWGGRPGRFRRASRPAVRARGGTPRAMRARRPPHGMARGEEKGTSDVDLLVVADHLTLEELFSALAPAEKRLGRKINPTLLTAVEVRKRRKARNHFLETVLSGTHVVLIGDVDAARATR